MSQYTVHRNLNPNSRQSAPLLLDVQANLLDMLPTRVTIPLIPRDKFTFPLIRALNPVLLIDGEAHVLVTQALAPSTRQTIGPAVLDASDHQHDIVAAIDCLLSGV